MKKLISLAIAILLSTPVLAAVNSSSISGTALEESVLTIKGKKLNSKSNPFTVILKTADGQSIVLPTTVKNKGKKAEISLPAIPAAVAGLIQIALEVSGGNVPASSPETFALILTRRPEGVSGPTGTADLPVLSDTTDDGLGIVGAAGAQGEPGEQGETGNQGPQGPTGVTPTSLPGGAIIGPVAQANQVVQASQNAITTLNNLLSFGKTGVTTAAKGPVSATEGFIGNLLGNVNGNVLGSSTTFTGSLGGDVGGTMAATTIANSVVTGKQLNGAYASSAGLVADGDSLQVAIAKLDGNTKTNATNIATNANGIAANLSDLTDATAANTTGELVRRDANGDFSADTITADTEFLGNLNGTVLTSVQNSIATMTGLTAIGTTAVTTTFAGPIVAAEGFTGPVAGLVTGNVTGDLTGQVSTASQATIANLPALVTAGTTLVNTTFAGPIIANEQIFGDLNGLVLTAIQTEVLDLPNLVQVGNTGSVPVNFRGKVAISNVLDVSSTVTAPLFSGPLSGNASSATIANTVSEPQQNAITSLLNLVDIGKGGVTTTVSGPIVALQGITGTLTGDINGNLNGSALEAVSLVNGATSLDITGGDAALLTSNGDVDLVLPSENGELALVADMNTADDALAALIGTNNNGVAANKLILDNATSTNTINTLILRDGSGDFSAGTVTATTFVGALSGNATSATTASSATTAASIDAGGSSTLTVAGGFGVTLNATALTSVTLPTTGTLAVVQAVDTHTVVGAAETVDAAGNSLVTVSGTGSIDFLSNGVAGQRVTLLFTVATVTITDDNVANADSMNIGVGGGIFSVNETLELISNGTSWYEVSRSAN